MSKSVKERINDGVEQLVTSVKAPMFRELKKNEAVFYVDTLIWQELSSIADSKLKKAWAEAQGADGVLVTDDEMRDLGEGEHIVSEAGSFSCVAKITKPQKRFDKDEFISRAVKQFKTTPAKVLALYEDCCKDGKPPLQKRILEA